MAISVLYRILAVFLACLQLVALAAKPDNGEASLEGPRGLKVFVGRRGGAIRIYRELSKEDGDKKPRKSGQITVLFGRIPVSYTHLTLPTIYSV